MASLTSSKILHQLADINQNTSLLFSSPHLDETRFLTVTMTKLCCSLQTCLCIHSLLLDQTGSWCQGSPSGETRPDSEENILRESHKTWLRRISMNKGNTWERDFKDDKQEWKERSKIQR